MAFLQCGFHSDVLGMASEMNVILPQQPQDEPLPVLYLLHGLSDDHTIWCRRTLLERYAAGLRLAIVMPNGHRAFYTDMAEGPHYFTFMAEELPSIVRAMFRVSDRREDSFVAGLSMGGYGALKMALTKPDRYAFAASLSGLADVAVWRNELAGDRGNAFVREMERVFGPLADIPDSEHDLFRLSADLVAAGRPLPDIYQCCGTEDGLYAGNVRFRDHLSALDWPLEYAEGPGGHSWDLWDRDIQVVLQRITARDGSARETPA